MRYGSGVDGKATQAQRRARKTNDAASM